MAKPVYIFDPMGLVAAPVVRPGLQHEWLTKLTLREFHCWAQNEIVKMQSACCFGTRQELVDVLELEIREKENLYQQAKANRISNPSKYYVKHPKVIRDNALCRINRKCGAREYVKKYGRNADVPLKLFDVFYG